MDKHLRSALKSSAEEFLSAAASLPPTKQNKSSLKTLVCGINPSSPSSLPPALHAAVSRSIDSFKKSLASENDAGELSRSPRSPPQKRPRRSSRHKNPSPPPADESEPLVSSQSEKLRHLKSLQIYAHIAQVCISHPTKCFPPSDLLPSVQLLHDSLLLYELDPALLSLVATLCEEWWKERLPGKETLISQSLPFLLSKSLDQGKKSDVHRVYALREAFTLFDFVDESSEDLRLLLVRCIITPLYLKTDEGRRFVAFMLGLNELLSKEALALMKSQIPFGRKSVLEAYAEILFRAWKSLEGCMREEIEDGFLQGLIEGAIYASSRTLAASVRRVLGGFIEQKATEGVDKLLFHLAEPVLFRSLQVANSNVRLNALHLLIDIFPLEDPDVTREAKDALLEKQFFLLERLLNDDCPDVRAVSVEGICRILNLFWEIIPSPTITTILSKIVDDIPHDLCYEVRLSTVNGVIYLLGNPQTHEVLKMLLPRLGCMFMDPVLSVRVAVADLLLAIRDIRTFHYNKVVCLDDLLSSLANDHSLVAQKITRLLIPSYFPSQKTIGEACSRFVALIKRSPIAGARLCDFAFLEGSSSKSLVELARTFVNLILSSKDLSTDQVDGLFAACANIFCSLSGETSCVTATTELITKDKFKRLLSAATSVRSQTSVLRIASIISPIKVAGFHEHCIGLVTNCSGLSEDQEMQMEIRTAHKLIFSSGRFIDLLEVLTNIMEIAASKFHDQFDLKLPKCNLPPLKNKKTKLPKKVPKKSDYVKVDGSSDSCMSSIDEYYAPAASAAWQLKDLLMSVEIRNIILKSISASAFSALRILSQVCIEQCIHQKSLDISPILAYLSLALHMSLQAPQTNPVDSNGSGSHCTGSSLEQTVLGKSLNHIVRCTGKLFSETETAYSSNTPEMKQEEIQHSRSKRKEVLVDSLDASEASLGIEDDAVEANKMANIVKMVTAVLKFVVDAATTELVSLDELSCLQLASAYAHHVISVLRKYQHHKCPFGEGTFGCLKSSFSYAAKLLRLALSPVESPMAQHEVSHLANSLLDLLTSIDLYLGSRYALRMISVTKPWLPDVIIGLCSAHVSHTTQAELNSAEGNYLPMWLATLGKVELYEINELNLDVQNGSAPESEASVIKKLMEMVLLLLKKGNPKILSAVVLIFMLRIKAALQRGEASCVLGLIHFLCVKLLHSERSTLRELEMMNKSLQDICLLIESTVSQKLVNDDCRHKLERARKILKTCT